MTAPVVELRAIDKRFGTEQVLDKVNLTLERGEVHALLGVNGAGKSTLIKILSGIYIKDGGGIAIDGVAVELKTPEDAIRHGVAAVQQSPELVPSFSGYENIALGTEKNGRGIFRRMDRQAMRRRTDELRRQFPVDVDLDRKVADMPAVDREIVAILHALSLKMSVLVLDEPTSVLTDREKVILFQLIRALKGSGIAIVFITHRLEEVFEIADRFTILRGGKNVATMRSDEAKDLGVSIATLMLGEKSGARYPEKTPAPGDVAMEVEGLARAGRFADVSFTARRGEILGVFGLVGSGLEDLANTLFGVHRPTAGTIEVLGKPVQLSGPGDALRKGVFLVPGDRRREGLNMTRDVTFNVSLANLGRISTGGLLRKSRQWTLCRDLAERVSLLPLDLARTAGSFSGGNQQKIVIAKGLFTEALVYLFLWPSMGVDIGAQSKIFALIRELSQSAAVIVFSSDSDEIYGLCDRIIALYRGRPTLQAPAEQVSREKVLMAGISGGALS
jgi:ABC-type sugar transport system ATPase subunit